MALRLGGSLAGTATALAPTAAPAGQSRAPVRKGKGAAPPALAQAPTSGDPAVFLARLMDLHGSVALGRELDALPRLASAAAAPSAPALAPAPASAPASASASAPAPATAPAPARSTQRDAAERAVRALVESRLEELATALCRTFDEPFHRRNKLPRPADVHALVEVSGVAAASAIWEPFGELAAKALTRVRAELKMLRAEIAPGLRAMGAEGAQLERLDAAITASIEPGRERVLGEVVPGLARSFSRSLQGALAELPAGAGVEHVAAWYKPGGWIRAEIDRIRRVVEAVLAHQARRLVALVDAAASGGAGR